MIKKVQIDSENKGLRLDKFVFSIYPNFSRSKIQKQIAEGIILVNDKTKKPSYILRENDLIAILVIDKDDENLRPINLKIDIIYEDTEIIVINKPQNLVVHPPQAHYDRTVVNALIGMKKELFVSTKLRPGIVHRLDKETSGVMVVVKTKEAYNSLVSQFKQRSVKKEYRAILWGKINEDKLTVDVPIARDDNNRLKMKISHGKGKDSITELSVMKRFENSTYVSLNLLTGRMHQIRVHMKHLGFPVLGDKKYGKKDGFNDLFLHSYFLSFVHPTTGKNMEFKAKLPEFFEDYLKENASV